MPSRMTVDAIVEQVDKATEPPMSKRKAIEWLENLDMEISVRIDALKEELGNDEG